MQQSDSLREGDRLMTICNSCRYCEGFCAVFPAMEKRVRFSGADLKYLANLCHNCGECFYACQYAPPHEFAVNVPKVLAQIRAESYKEYAWPGMIDAAWWTAIPFAIVFALLRPITERIMVGVFGAAGLLVLLSWGIGLKRMWGQGFGPVARLPLGVSALTAAVKDILTLSNLSSHGAGCTWPDERHSQSRRIFHHLTFYGFLLCFASTSVAAFYDDVLGWKPPYPYLSAPVVLGTIGGIGLIAGPVGLLALKRRRDKRLVDTNQDPMDFSFIGLLVAVAITGLALMLLRSTSALNWLLVVHLALVSALFVTFACGKFVHGIYRSAALLRSALEQRRSD